MMFNVPQFIDVEDKIAGPLTAKQLLWMFGMAAAILVIRLFTGGGAVMYVISVPVVVLFALLAFYRPHGQPLITFVIHGIFFLFRPKVMMWRRPQTGAIYPSVHGKARMSSSQPRKRESRVTTDEIRDIAAILDADKEQ